MNEFIKQLGNLNKLPRPKEYYFVNRMDSIISDLQDHALILDQFISSDILEAFDNIIDATTELKEELAGTLEGVDKALMGAELDEDNDSQYKFASEIQDQLLQLEDRFDA